MPGKKKASARGNEMNTMEIVFKLKPFQSPGDPQVYVINEVKDDTGQVVNTEELLLESEQGLELVTAVIAEKIETLPDRGKINAVMRSLKAQSNINPRRVPTRLIQTVPTQPVASQ